MQMRKNRGLSLHKKEEKLADINSRLAFQQETLLESLARESKKDKDEMRKLEKRCRKMEATLSENLERFEKIETGFSEKINCQTQFFSDELERKDAENSTKINSLLQSFSKLDKECHLFQKNVILFQKLINQENRP